MMHSPLVYVDTKHEARVLIHFITFRATEARTDGRQAGDGKNVELDCGLAGALARRCSEVHSAKCHPG